MKTSTIAILAFAALLVSTYVVVALVVGPDSHEGRLSEDRQTVLLRQTATESLGCDDLSFEPIAVQYEEDGSMALQSTVFVRGCGRGARFTWDDFGGLHWAEAASGPPR